jgi:hypothetical protein
MEFLGLGLLHKIKKLGLFTDLENRQIKELIGVAKERLKRDGRKETDDAIIEQLNGLHQEIKQHLNRIFETSIFRLYHANIHPEKTGLNLEKAAAIAKHVDNQGLGGTGLSEQQIEGAIKGLSINIVGIGQTPHRIVFLMDKELTEQGRYNVAQLWQAEIVKAKANGLPDDIGDYLTKQPPETIVVGGLTPASKFLNLAGATIHVFNPKIEGLIKKYVRSATLLKSTM